MKNIKIVNGPVNAPAIVLGCMRMPALTVEEAEKVIRNAYELGVNYFDHATCYGDGAAEERCGRLYACVNNAAHLGVGMSVLNSTEADWDAVMNANARAALFGSQEAVKLMEGGGSIVFISSCHAKRTIPGRALYTASKAAIGGITRSLALELGCLGIRVNAILAGAIRTDRWDGLTAEEVSARRARWPAGIESTPDDIAAMVAYLCSDAARTITGTEIPVDSGVGVSLLQYNKDWMKNDPNNAKYWEKGK